MQLNSYLSDPLVIAILVAAALTLVHLVVTAIPLLSPSAREERQLQEQLQQIFVHAKLGTAELMRARARQLSSVLRHMFDVGLDLGLVVPHAKRSLHGQKP